MVIEQLRANHLVNPLGFELDRPVLTWVVSEARGKRQQAARVQVALRPDFEECLWDSGMRESISSLGCIPELELRPRTRYYWRAEVLTDEGERAFSAPAWFETAKMDEPWAAEWIAAPFDKETHPLLRRAVTLRQKPVRARIYASGLGLYELSIGDEKVGDEVLTPFYNDYEHWVQYQTWDVTDSLREGANTLTVMLGNGWYKGRFGFVPEMRELYGDRMQLLLELRVEYADGTREVIGTDPSWLCHASPVLESSIYDGEIWDARRELPADTTEGFAPAVVVAAPKGRLSARMSPPLRVCEQVKPVELIRTPAGEQVIDFGQEVTGWVAFDCDLPEGAEVLLEHGELLQRGNFYRDNLRTAKQEYRYVSAGRVARVRPRFTFYGFRFVKVTGMDVRPKDFTACVIHTDLPVAGSITTSNEKVNRLILNALWGQKGNFVDVPTDCPQRDERMGWTGDAHVFAPTASFNMYTPAFYGKYLRDMLLEQRTLGGAVPFVVPDAIDRIAAIQKTPADSFGSCAWGDAAVGIPWTLYTFYGDRALLEAQYENMRLWVDWIHRQDEERCGGDRLWRCGFHFADWLALDNPEQDSRFGGTDPYFIASAYYYDSTRLTARAAEALGRRDDAERYAALAEEVRAAVRREYFTETGRIAVPTQTAMVMALYMDIVPPEHRERLIADLLAKLEARKWHMDTGFVGTYYLCRTLSLIGRSDVAYTLLLNEDYPSWLYEVNMGATTVWERWNSVLPDGLMSDTGMNSLNHYAYGSVVEWMYRCMCGLNPCEDAPGFKRCVVAPHTDPRFGWVRARYDSASGRYEIAWTRAGKVARYELTVPFDCEADFVPEDATAGLTLNGQPVVLTDGRLRLPAGKYEIVCDGTGE